MELRHWLLIVCVLAILVIFVDGYRRWKERPRYKGTMTTDADALDEFPSAELPTGGARVRPLTPEEITHRNEKLSLEKHVPILMDSVTPEPTNEDENTEPSPQQEMEWQDDNTEDMFGFEEQAQAVDQTDTEQLDDSPTVDSENLAADADQDHFVEDDTRIEPSFDSDLDFQQEPMEVPEAEPEAKEERIDVFAQEEPGLDVVEPEDVIVINVLATDEVGFDGEHLLQILLACGMRFGSMDIFHRTDEDNRVQFSMANVTKPGTFNLDTIGQSQISGVSFFMTLPCSAEAMESFDYMYETANVLARHLHGTMKDEMHSVFTGQTVEHCRNRIREFARSQLINA